MVDAGQCTLSVHSHGLELFEVSLFSSRDQTKQKAAKLPHHQSGTLCAALLLASVQPYNVISIPRRKARNIDMTSSGPGPSYSCPAVLSKTSAKTLLLGMLSCAVYQHRPQHRPPPGQAAMSSSGRTLRHVPNCCMKLRACVNVRASSIIAPIEAWARCLVRFTPPSSIIVKLLWYFSDPCMSKRGPMYTGLVVESRKSTTQSSQFVRTNHMKNSLRMVSKVVPISATGPLLVI